MDTVFFWVSKLAWPLVKPETLLILLATSGLACFWAGARKRAGLIFTMVVGSMVAVAVLPWGHWLLSPLEHRFTANPELPEQVDGIIVLAGPEDSYRSALWQQIELGDGAERLIYFMTLMRDYPDARHVFSGGTGSLSRQAYKSADVARKMLAGQGWDVDRILFESESRNTYENARASRDLVAPEPGDAWVLITTARHMPRAVGVFERLGWPVIPFPVDHCSFPPDHEEGGPGLGWDFASHLNALQNGIREWVGLAAYYATGKTSALLPPAPGNAVKAAAQ